MKKFEFKLDSALRWRTTQLQLERARLQNLLAEQQRINRDLKALADERNGAVDGLQSLPRLEAFDLRSLSAYLVGAEFRATQLHEQLRRRTALVQKQQARVLDAELQVKLLDKLKCKKRAEWQSEYEKDTESNAAEAWLAAHFGPNS